MTHTKSYNLFFTCIFFILFIAIFPFFSNAKRDIPKGESEIPSPFHFIQHLEGCHKGENRTGLHKLKTYLKKFGYINYHHTKYESHAKDEEFDDLLESALKIYQSNFHLNVTGFLDSETVAKMVMPRCGVADIINGTNWMVRSKNKNHHHHHHIHGVAHYSFFPQRQRWPASKTHLTYAFEQNTPRDAVQPVERAFGQWASRTHFTFSRAQNPASADMKIGFHRREHGDGAAFDGPGGTIAHAFAPTDGRFHFDGDEQFSIGPHPQAFDLETVALHEIGHLLGLSHSEVEGAIMYPTIAKGKKLGLHQDDIQGIKALYNV